MSIVYAVFTFFSSLHYFIVHGIDAEIDYDFFIIPAFISTAFGILLSRNEILKKRLAKSNLVKSQFLSRASHELRTPLNAILGFGQILSLNSNQFSENQKNHLNRILDSGKHLLKIVNELLELSSMEAGKLQLNFSSVNICECLKDSVELLSPLAKKHNVTIDFDACENESFKLNADPSRVLEVFLNIGTNAIKYNEPGGNLTIKCKNITSHEILISFKDTGPGIPENKLQEIFDPFSSISNNNSAEVAGLGLAITRNLLSLMHGEIACKNNNPDKGCEFQIKFSRQ